MCWGAGVGVGWGVWAAPGPLGRGRGGRGGARVTGRNLMFWGLQGRKCTGVSSCAQEWPFPVLCLGITLDSAEDRTGVRSISPNYDLESLFPSYCAPPGSAPPAQPPAEAHPTEGALEHPRRPLPAPTTTARTPDLPGSKAHAPLVHTLSQHPPSPPPPALCPLCRPFCPSQ